MNGIFGNYLWIMFWGSTFLIFWIMWFFPRKYKYRYIRVYVWSKDDKHAIWMWIWLILTNINLLNRIWSVWLVRFAHFPTNFIYLLNRLVFSVSINSHSDNIYLLKLTCVLSQVRFTICKNPSTIRVTWLLHWTSVIIANILINDNN